MEAALFVACSTGMPSIDRLVTITGTIVRAPTVMNVRIGTPFSHLIAECGGLVDPIAKIVAGGPMMGVAQYSTDVPVTKTVSCLFLMSEKEAKPLRLTNCIHCGKCMRGCPMRLIPCYLNSYSDSQELEQLEGLNIDDCIECGACNYVCPARLPMLQKFKMMKMELAKQRQAASERHKGVQ